MTEKVDAEVRKRITSVPLLDLVLNRTRLNQCIQPSGLFTQGSTAHIYYSSSQLTDDERLRLNSMLGRNASSELLIKLRKMDTGVGEELFADEVFLISRPEIQPFSIATSNINSVVVDGRIRRGMLMEKAEGIELHSGARAKSKLSSVEAARSIYQFLMVCGAFNDYNKSPRDLKDNLVYQPSAIPPQIVLFDLQSMTGPDFKERMQVSSHRAWEYVVDTSNVVNNIDGFRPIDFKRSVQPEKIKVDEVLKSLANFEYASFYEAADALDRRFNGLFSQEYERLTGLKPKREFDNQRFTLDELASARSELLKRYDRWGGTFYDQTVLQNFLREKQADTRKDAASVRVSQGESQMPRQSKLVIESDYWNEDLIADFEDYYRQDGHTFQHPKYNPPPVSLGKPKIARHADIDWSKRRELDKIRYFYNRWGISRFQDALVILNIYNQGFDSNLRSELANIVSELGDVANKYNPWEEAVVMLAKTRQDRGVIWETRYAPGQTALELAKGATALCNLNGEPVLLYDLHQQRSGDGKLELGVKMRRENKEDFLPLKDIPVSSAPFIVLSKVEEDVK